MINNKQEKLNLLQQVFGTYRKEGSGQYLFKCPNPNCFHHKNKFSINLEKGAKCWICDIRSSNIGTFVKRYGTRDQYSKWLEFSGEEENKKDIFNKRDENITHETILNLPQEYNTLVKSDLPLSSQRPLNYLKNRGITKKDIIRWKIGYALFGEYKERIIVPSFNRNGYINYFVARTYGNSYIIYLKPQAEQDIIFNELFLNWNDDIVLVEGVFDAIVADNAIPLLTSTLREDSKLFQSIVNNKKEVYLCLDSDAKKKEIKIIESFLKHDVNIYRIDISPYKDVGEISKQEFGERKNVAKKINKLELLKMRVYE